MSFPRLAMDKRKALSCLRTKFSSVRSRNRAVDFSVFIPKHALAFSGRNGTKGRKCSLPMNQCLSNGPLKLKWSHFTTVSAFDSSRLPSMVHCNTQTVKMDVKKQNKDE